MDFNSTLTVLRRHDQIQNPDASSYILNGRIMLCSVIVLFVVIVIIVCIHSYARWLFHRNRRARQLFFFSATNTSSGNINRATPQPQSQAKALDLSVLKRIPTFVYSSNTHDRVLDCPVCLSEFEDNEKGRVLPTCKHAFHVSCIDMWFCSHSNCPLCRTPVQLPPVEDVVPVIEEVGSVAEREIQGVHQMGCSSSSSTTTSLRPALEVVSVLVEIPRGDFRGLDDMGLGPDSAGNGFKSPGNRVLTLKRIWSV